MLKNDLEKILISEEEIQNMCKKLGKEISLYYQDKNPLCIGLLKGCLPFMSDLLKYVDCYLEVAYMGCSSYHGTSSSELIITQNIQEDLNGRNVLLIDDIVDTGKTVNRIKEMMLRKGAKEVKVVTLLDKPEGRKIDFKVDWFGTTVPKEFVVGYGLDYNQQYRNLPCIGVLKKEIYSEVE